MIKDYYKNHKEKKYRVESFKKILQLLKEKKAQKGKEIVAIHYYGEHKSNDVEKFVEYEDRYEIHVLKESNGTFTMAEHSPIADKKAGMIWLKKRGFKTVNIVKMAYTEYSYKNGTVGLYVINDFLHSVILYYPKANHETMEKEFKLTNAEVISVPYNKYLEKIGKLQSKKI